LLVGLFVVLHSQTAHAVRRRPRFEPTDLSLAEPGELSLDVELGFFTDTSGHSLPLPDFELNLGLTREVELDIDGAFALTNVGVPGQSAVPSPDNLWVSLKFGLFATHSHRGEKRWSVGMQLGPRIAMAPGSEGFGAEMLVLVSRHWPGWTLSFNTGGYTEPRVPGQAGIDRGIVLGVDLSHELSTDWSVSAEIFGAKTNGIAPDQLGGTLGLAWQCLPALELSVRTIATAVGTGPGYGFFFGFSPTFHLWS
jgi:hypothetical protein